MEKFGRLDIIVANACFRTRRRARKWSATLLDKGPKVTYGYRATPSAAHNVYGKQSAFGIINRDPGRRSCNIEGARVGRYGAEC